MEQTNNDCRFWIFTFDKFTYTSDVCLLEDKVQDRGMYLFASFLRKRCNGSKKWRGVDSEDDLKIFVHLYGVFRMPADFEVLDARIASALNKIIHNSHFKRRCQSGGTNRPRSKRAVSFVAGRLLTLIYDYFRVTGIHDSVENCADLFTIAFSK